MNEQVYPWQLSNRLRLDKIPFAGFVIYQYMRGFAEQGKPVFVSQPAMSHLLSIPLRTLKDEISRLVEKGYLKVHRGAVIRGKHNPKRNTYEVVGVKTVPCSISKVINEAERTK